MMLVANPVRIIAIDPGYDRVGWAIGDAQGVKVTPLEYGCVETDRKLPLLARYQQIIVALDELLVKYEPQEAAIETLFFSKNKSTAMDVSEARGVILSCFLRRQMQCYEYSPVGIKLAVTGYGQADKAAVAKMVTLQLGLAKGLQSAPKKVLDDTLDALALLLTHTVSRSSYQAVAKG